MLIKYRILTAVSVCLIICFVVQCGNKGANWEGSISIENGVTVIKNPDKPLYEDILEPEEDLVIKDSVEGQYLLARPSTLLLDEEDNIYILDQRESNIKVFGNSGDYLRTIGKKGQGPGELRMAASMSLSPQNELVVSDTGNRRLTFYSLDGEYLRSLPTRKLIIGNAEFDSQGNIYSTIYIIRDGQRRYELQKFDSKLNYLSTVAYEKVPDETLLVRPTQTFFLSMDDSIVYGYGETYEIKIFNNAGTLSKRILKSHDPVQIFKEEIELRSKNMPPGAEFAIPEYYPPYYRISGDDEGRIFVLIRQKLIENEANDFEVFSAEGKYLGSIGLRTVNPLFRKNRLYTIEEDEEGLPIVKRYRVKWKPRDS